MTSSSCLLSAVSGFSDGICFIEAMKEVVIFRERKTYCFVSFDGSIRGFKRSFDGFLTRAVFFFFKIAKQTHLLLNALNIYRYREIDCLTLSHCLESLKLV